MAGSNPPSPDAVAGRRMGNYEILSRLSTGGMSEIFLAFQRGLGGFRKLVVLKQILPDIQGEDEFVRMFLDEARITGMFAHPNIAQVFDLDVSAGALFLAMEFVAGATLVEVARACRQANEPIPIGLTLMAVRDTALALHYAHTFTDPAGRPLTVIHRDVAEKNIMVTFEGVTKLLDFGIAKNPNWSGRTMVGMVKGTSGYMSPEQITGQALDARSDIFSLGVVFHECLTGMRLYPSKNAEEAMLAVLRENPSPPSKQSRDVSPEIDQVVLKALARKREDRYATALELARDIERVAQSSIWLPEQVGALVARFFAGRRTETEKLLSQTEGDETGQIRLSELLAHQESMPDEPPAPARARKSMSRPWDDGLPSEPRTVLDTSRASASRPRGPGLAQTVPSGRAGRLSPAPPPTVALPAQEADAPSEELSFDEVPAEEPRFDDSPESVVSTVSRLIGRGGGRAWAVWSGLVAALLGIALWVVAPHIPALGGFAHQFGPPQLGAPPVAVPEPLPRVVAPPPEAPPKEREAAPAAPPPVVLAPEPRKPAERPDPPAERKAGPKVSTNRVISRGEKEEHPRKRSQAPFGALSLVTNPPSRVVVDAEDVGGTPLWSYRLAAGTHTLKLIGPDGTTRRLMVDIRAGAVTDLSVRLGMLPSD